MAPGTPPSLKRHHQDNKENAMLTANMEGMLCHAAQTGDCDTMGMLLGNAVIRRHHINHRQALTGTTALHAAATPQTLAMLLNAGADMGARDAQGFTPLLCKARAGGQSNHSFDALLLLLERGADVHAKTPRGCGAIHLWARYATNTVHRRPRLTPASQLAAMAKRGLDIGARDTYGGTALHHYSAKQYLRPVCDELMQAFEAAGLTAKTTDSFDRTPLHYAARASPSSLFLDHVGRGAELGALDAFGRAPTYYSLYSCTVWPRQRYQRLLKEDIVEQLVAGSIASDAHGHSALHFVSCHGFQRAGSSHSERSRAAALQASALHAYVELRRGEKGESAAQVLDARDDRGMAPIHYAAVRGDAAWVEALVQEGADVHRLTGKGATALGLALSRGHREAAAALMECNKAGKRGRGNTTEAIVAFLLTL